MTRLRGLCAALLCALLHAAPLQAHPLAPALLELRETADGAFDVRWLTSVLRVRGGELTPVWPADCVASEVAPAQLVNDEAAIEVRSTLRCPGSLVGRTLGVAGLDGSGVNVIVNVRFADQRSAQALLDPGITRFTVPEPLAQPPVFAHYLELGVGHLLFGFDHVLFVLGLLLLVRRPRLLVVTVTAFTLGHSVTLALAALGFVRVSPALTELAIALSILFLATAVARPATAPTPALARWPWAIALGFGLLHGLGFAGALAEVGLPQDEIPLALLAFNIGIELGQLMLIAAALGVVALLRRLPALTPPRRLALRLLPAYVMGTLAAYWCLQRAEAVWS